VSRRRALGTGQGALVSFTALYLGAARPVVFDYVDPVGLVIGANATEGEKRMWSMVVIALTTLRAPTGGPAAQ
jgi:hypothetical protein